MEVNLGIGSMHILKRAFELSIHTLHDLICSSVIPIVHASSLSIERTDSAFGRRDETPEPG